MKAALIEVALIVPLMDSRIDFSSNIAAFGFYGVDIGDFNGVVQLRLDGAVVTTVPVGNSTNVAGGGDTIEHLLHGL